MRCGLGCMKQEDDIAARPGHTGSLGVIGVASLAFFAVAGSPAGTEDAIAAAGPLYGLLGFLVMPLVWSIPEALITAELAAAFPHNGGFVVWVGEAFGEKCGYIEGFLKWFSGTLDNAVYPVMMLNYLQKVIPTLHTEVARNFFLAGSVAVLTFAQYAGLEVVGVTSSLVIVMTLLPFVVMVILGLPQVEPSKLIEQRPVNEVDWGLFLTTLFWNLNYWDSVSTLAAEVNNPGRTFPRALALAMVGVILMYVLVLGVAIGTADTARNSSWDNAELANAGEWIGGEWLKVWIVIAVSISCVGLYLAEISTDIFMVAGMAELGLIPKLFDYKNKCGTPVAALVMQTSLVCLFLWLLEDMEMIIAWEMVGYCLAQLLEFAAFVKLRLIYPDVKRPFKSPGGVKTSIALLTPAAIFTVVLMGVSTWDVWVAGVCQLGVSYLLAIALVFLRSRHPHWFVPATSASLRSIVASDLVANEIELDRGLLLPNEETNVDDDDDDYDDDVDVDNDDDDYKRKNFRLSIQNVDTVRQVPTPPQTSSHDFEV